MSETSEWAGIGDVWTERREGQYRPGGESRSEEPSVMEWSDGTERLWVIERQEGSENSGGISVRVMERSECTN